MLRVTDETREKVLRIGREEFGGASADETIRRLIDEHWMARAVAVMDRFRQDDPQGWADYLVESEELSGADCPVAE